MSEISMQQLKEQRLTPAEKFVLNKVKGAKVSEPYGNGDVIWYDKDGELLFQQDFKNTTLWVSYTDIWFFLVKQYCLNYDETQRVIYNVMYKYTNNGQLTPFAEWDLDRKKPELVATLTLV
jgi:hypothetical protein